MTTDRLIVFLILAAPAVALLLGCLTAAVVTRRRSDREMFKRLQHHRPEPEPETGRCLFRSLKSQISNLKP